MVVLTNSPGFLSSTMGGFCGPRTLSLAFHHVLFILFLWSNVTTYLCHMPSSLSTPCPVASVDPHRVSIYPVVLGSEGNFHHFLSSHGHSKVHSLPGLADSF